MSEEENILKVEIKDRICLLTLNRPDRRNAMSRALGNALRRAIIKADTDNSVSMVAITGAGSAFCAGADLKDARATDESTGDYRGPLHEPERSLFEVMLDSRKPIMGIINGPAIAGGCELALSCDLRVVADAMAHGSGVPDRAAGVPAEGSAVHEIRHLGQVAAALDRAEGRGWQGASRGVELGARDRGGFQREHLCG